MVHEPDKDDAEAMVAEGRIRGQLYRIVYGIDRELDMPITIIPITGFPFTRRSCVGVPHEAHHRHDRC